MSKEKATTTDVAEVPKAELSYGARFTNTVLSKFSELTSNDISITPFQKRLINNYFVKLSNILEDNERKRMAKAEQYREALAYTWANVNMNKLAIDVLAYSVVGLDPNQPNHINIIPYKNNSSNKWDITFIVGYVGVELKAKKYGLDIPDNIVAELVYKNDKFKQFKKDMNNRIEGYSFEVVNDFDRGELVGGFWYHEFRNNPEKNKLRVFSLADIEKRKPKYASAEFWGGEKDTYSNGKKTGTEKVEGWNDEMALKTILRNAWGKVVIDSQKIDEVFQIMERQNAEVNYIKEAVDKEILENANKSEFVYATEVEQVVLPQAKKQVEVNEIPEPVAKADAKQLDLMSHINAEGGEDEMPEFGK